MKLKWEDKCELNFLLKFLEMNKNIDPIILKTLQAILSENKVTIETALVDLDKFVDKNGKQFINERSEENLGYAMYLMSICCRLGIGYQQDEKLAFKFLMDSMRKGNPIAKYDLGRNVGVPAGTHGKAALISWLEQAAKHYPAARYYLSKELPENSKQAMELIKTAAEHGYPYAQYQLGILFENGKEGIFASDKGQSHYYLQCAADQFHCDAQFAIARQLEEGIGCVQNFSEAMKYYKQAWLGGNLEAGLSLGRALVSPPIGYLIHLDDYVNQEDPIQHTLELHNTVAINHSDFGYGRSILEQIIKIGSEKQQLKAKLYLGRNLLCIGQSQTTTDNQYFKEGIELLREVAETKVVGSDQLNSSLMARVELVKIDYPKIKNDEPDVSMQDVQSHQKPSLLGSAGRKRKAQEIDPQLKEFMTSKRQALCSEKLRLIKLYNNV